MSKSDFIRPWQAHLHAYYGLMNEAAKSYNATLTMIDKAHPSDLGVSQAVYKKLMQAQSQYDTVFVKPGQHGGYDVELPDGTIVKDLHEDHLVHEGDAQPGDHGHDEHFAHHDGSSTLMSRISDTDYDPHDPNAIGEPDDYELGESHKHKAKADDEKADEAKAEEPAEKEEPKEEAEESEEKEEGEAEETEESDEEVKEEAVEKKTPVAK